jgi:ATP-dependent RNA helicase MSS116
MSTNPNFAARGLPRQANRGAMRGRGRSTRPVTVFATETRGLATNVAAFPRAEILVEERSATPTTIGRHFSDRKFADAPISNQSKAGLKHE